MEQRQERARSFLGWGIILVVAGLVLLLAASAVGGFGPGGMPGGVMPPGGMMPGFGGGFANPFWQVLTFLAWVLVVGGIVLLAIWLARTLAPEIGAPAAAAPEEPLRIAQLRYARGEISRDEYERIREDLTRAA